MTVRALVFLALTALVLGPVTAAAADDEQPEGWWREKNAFEVWEAEHKWVRLGIRFYGFNPAIQDHAALKLGPGMGVPLTTDFFMGIGMKIAFLGSYNTAGSNDVVDCVDRGGVGDDPACPSGHRGGVDYTWLAPIDPDGNIDGSNPNSVPSQSGQIVQERRRTHVAFFALTIGGNYELTIPNLQFFRVFQPFVGGGVVLAWIQTYSDLDISEFVLIDNPDNNAFDDDNVDPYSDQGPEVGGEVYGGFHLNVAEIFRFTFEVGYHNVLVTAEELQKATSGFETRHLEYRLSQLRFGGGFEFRF
jgi:hypothetical protein